MKGKATLAIGGTQVLTAESALNLMFDHALKRGDCKETYCAACALPLKGSPTKRNVVPCLRFFPSCDKHEKLYQTAPMLCRKHYVETRLEEQAIRQLREKPAKDGEFSVN